MASQLTPTLGNIPSAFAAACRQARTDSELFERCRDVLVQRFDSDQIWFAINSGKAGSRRVGGADGFAAAVEAAAEPRFDPLGRERAWKASRFEALERLTGASARVADIWLATEIHTCGMALTDIRRLGVEYARTAAPAPPEDLLWWHTSILEVLGGQKSEARPSLQSEFRQLSREVAAYLTDERS